MATRCFKIFATILILGVTGWTVTFFYTENITTKMTPYDVRLAKLEAWFQSQPLLLDMSKITDPPDDLGGRMEKQSESWWQRWFANRPCAPVSGSSPDATRALVSADRHLLVCDINPRTQKLWKQLGNRGNFTKMGQLANDELNELFASSKTRRVLVTRDPYSQVMATYIDTFFLPNATGWQQHGAAVLDSYGSEWRKRPLAEKPCNHDVTFSEYLAYITHDNQTAPQLIRQIRDQCDSCSSRYDAIVRHEALPQTLLNSSADVDMKSLWNAVDREQILEDIERYYAQQKLVSGCMPPYEALQKLWRSWQIYGILGLGAKFPYSKPAQAENATQKEFAELALKALTAGESESKAVRFRNEMIALKEAFAEVTVKVKLRLEFLLRDVSASLGYKSDPFFLYLTNGVFFREDKLSLFSINFD